MNLRVLDSVSPYPDSPLQNIFATRNIRTYCCSSTTSFASPKPDRKSRHCLAVLLVQWAISPRWRQRWEHSRNESHPRVKDPLLRFRQYMCRLTILRIPPPQRLLRIWTPRLCWNGRLRNSASI